MALIALAVQTALFSQATPKLSLKLERMQGEGISDHAVFVSVQVTNTSQQAIEVEASSVPEHQYTFAVVGPDGRPAAPARDAEKHRRDMSGEVGLLLEPGQSRTFGYTPLSDLVDFSRPGTYRITATRHFGAPSDETRSFDPASRAGLPATRHLGVLLDETDTSDVLEVKVP